MSSQQWKFRPKSSRQPRLNLRKQQQRQKSTHPFPHPEKPAHYPEHGTESMDDFSAALEAFEREQAAEAAAVEAYGDKVVSGTVIKHTDKHLVVDVGLKSEVWYRSSRLSIIPER